MEKSNVPQHGTRMQAKAVMPQNQLMLAGLAHTQISVKQQTINSFMTRGETHICLRFEKRRSCTLLLLSSELYVFSQHDCIETAGCAKLPLEEIVYILIQNTLCFMLDRRFETNQKEIIAFVCRKIKIWSQESISQIN